jgi:hypothetical protein
VARKSKIETQKPADGQGSEPTGGSATGTDLKTTGAAPKPQKKKTAPKKKISRPSQPATSEKKSAPAPSVREPSDEEIRIRAYFIAERRIQLSLAGDSAHDWVEARRQLIEEAGPASS